MSDDRPYYPPPPPPHDYGPGPGTPFAPGPSAHAGWQGAASRQVPAAASRPAAYWPLTIASAIFSLIGLLAVYFSWQVGKKWEVGDVEGAQKASKAAMWVGIVCLVLGVLALLGS